MKETDYYELQHDIDSIMHDFEFARKHLQNRPDKQDFLDEFMMNTSYLQDTQHDTMTKHQLLSLRDACYQLLFNMSR